jgi:tripeptide aminopeptidase
MTNSTRSTHPTVNRARLLDRFLRYVQIGTAADPRSETYPSTMSQRTLATMLCGELEKMGLHDAHVDENALVWGTVPATHGGQGPTVALVAHMDTSPEASGDSVKPQVIDAYSGGDIVLPSGIAISPSTSPTLDLLIGKTLITTDGTTLLGGDDKAGIAIIMEVAESLVEQPSLQHGDVKLLFTCDEEIGRGTDKINLRKLDATVAYTLDGGGSHCIDVETFSADAATVRFIGHNIHPAIAKDRMVNAVRAAADFVAGLPRDQCSPETTSDRQGFIHPHTIRGGVGEAVVELILRSFDSSDLQVYADRLREIAAPILSCYPGLKIEVETRQQYRNLREGLEREPAAVGLAIEAYEQLGRPYRTEIVRGGTDGSQLTEKGLPTPNLSSGQHNIHSVTEFACLDEMVDAAEHLIELLRLWGERRY